jgi:hypothetical protein
MPTINLSHLEKVSRKSYDRYVDEMFLEMGGEYDRFRLENLLKRKPLAELLK